MTKTCNIVSLLLLATICCVQSEIEFTLNNFRKQLNDCKKEFPISKEIGQMVFHFIKAPEDPIAKQWSACWMTRVGFIENNKINVETMKKWDKELWLTADQKLLADENTEYCNRKITATEPEEIANELMVCFFPRAQEIGLRGPDALKLQQ